MLRSKTNRSERKNLATCTDTGMAIYHNMAVNFDIISQLANNIKIHSHVVIDGHTRIGAGSEIFPFAAIGLAPQHTRYEGEASELIIGENNLMREYVNMHPGTKVGNMKTIIGDNNLFYVGAHVAHGLHAHQHKTGYCRQL